MVETGPQDCTRGQNQGHFLGLSVNIQLLGTNNMGRVIMLYYFAERDHSKFGTGGTPLFERTYSIDIDMIVRMPQKFVLDEQYFKGPL